MRKPKKPKPVNYLLIDRDSDFGRPMYQLLAELVEQHHEELTQARIALAWNTAWKPDVDGRVTLGKCKKASDLDRELASFDFVILLRRAFWLDSRVSDQQRRALLDHELHHAAVKYDETGEPVQDERGRMVYRTRKHDIEEFAPIVRRYGLWTADIERFAIALQRSSLSEPFQACEKCKREGAPGWQTVESGGTKRLDRCECFKQWLKDRQAWLSEQPAAAQA